MLSLLLLKCSISTFCLPNLTFYYAFQQTNPYLKEGLERSEDYAFWMRQKANEVIHKTHLDQPLKQLDVFAAQGITRVEETTKYVNTIER